MESLRRFSTGVAARIRNIENKFRTEKIERHKLHNDVDDYSQDEVENVSIGCGRTRNYLQRFIKICESFLRTSRFAGIPLSIVYGVFLYLYITYMILPGPDTTAVKSEHQNISRNGNSACRFMGNISDPYNKIMSGNLSSISSVADIQDNPPDINVTSSESKYTQQSTEFIGIGVSSGMTVIFGITSVFSRHTRCTMMLILPSIITGRGRSFLMTLVMGLLIEGPINSINENINRIVESISCMYESMKNMACLFTIEFQRIMAYMVDMVKQQQTRFLEDLRETQKKMLQYTDKALQEITERQKQLQKRLHELNKELDGLKDFLDSVNKPCKYAESAIGGVSGFFDDVFGEISSWFSKKRKRRRRASTVNICGKSNPFPNVNIEPGIDTETLEELKMWIRDILPDLDLKNVNLPDLKNLVNASSVEDIRKKILTTVSDLFNLIRDYLTIIKKFFLLVSLLLLTIDSVRYLKKYYSDDSFDNQFIDNNIRTLWRHRGFEKLTPLRHWELNTKYQVSASPKLSKEEFKRIFVNAFPSIIVTLLVVFIILGDYALAELLMTLTVNGKFALSFEGMEQGFNLQQIFTKYKVFDRGGTNNMAAFNLRKIDLSSDPCLPRPVFTSNRRISIIIVLLVLMALSCFFDAYAMRLRARICNVFYHNRASERSEYLHKNISFARKTRRFNLQMIIMKELRRRQKVREFSWLFRLPYVCDERSTGNKIHCPGCLWKVKMADTKEIQINIESNTVTSRLCNDCHKDL